MAENTQEKKTFKWGENEYLLDDLLKLHAEQENNYYNFARSRGQYDDTALAGLRAAISSRIGAVKNGQVFSADGVLDTDKVDNTTIQTQKKGLFKKEKYVDQDNTEWAKYYLNKLVGQLKPYQREAAQTFGDWDISKHGLNAYLTGQGLNAQDIFENYDGRDATNPDAARSFAQRDAKLREQLGEYKTWLEGKGFDFTKNDNEWDDNFMATLSDLINNQDWSDRTALAASLRKLGAGDGYTTAFTSDRWDLTKSDSDLQTESKQRKEQEAAKVKSEYVKKAQDAFLNNYKEEKGSYLNFADYTNHNFGEGVTPSFMNYYADLNKDQQKPYGTYLGTSSESWDKAYQTLMQSLRDGTAYTDNNKGIILQRYFEDAPNGFTDVGDGLYLVNESINDMGEGYVYDPVSKYFQKRHISEFANQNANVKKAYEDLLYDYINKTYGTNYDTRTYVSFKEGGVLKAQLGAAVLRPYDVNEQYKEKSSESGLDVETQKARDRYINSDNKSETNPNARFTGAEVARLVSIGADITSMFLDPITGTTTGLGSSILNFGADIADDGFQWEDVKNLGINVGFDLLGAIPIFGDAVGTRTKITRKLIKWAPRMMGILAGYQGVKNFGGMMESWQKMVSNDEDAKMTVQDWRNIAQSISLVTGGVRATRNKIAQNKMKNSARVDGVVGVNVYNKQTQKMERVLVDGDTAKNVRDAQGDKAKIEAELSKLDDFKDKFGESGTLEVATGMGGLQKPWEKVTDANGKTSRQLRSIFSDGKAQVTDVYDFSRVNGAHSNIAKWLSTKGTPTIENNQKGKMSSEVFEAKQKELLDQAGVEAQVGKVKEAVEARKKYLENLQGKIGDVEGEITATKQAAGGDDFVAQQASAEALLAGLPSKQKVNDAQAIIESRQRFIEQTTKKRQDLGEARQKQMSDMETGMNARLDAMNKTLRRLTARKKVLEKKKADGTIGKKELTELNNLSGRIKTTKASIKTTKADIVKNTERIKLVYGKKRSELKANIKSAKKEKAAQVPIAAQRQSVLDAVAQRDAAISGQALQKRLNTLQGRKASHDPVTAHTHAFKELETMLNNLRTSNPTIGGKTVSWDMDAILQKYGVKASDVFKQGGSINRNKINKFLNYAKG